MTSLKLLRFLSICGFLISAYLLSLKLTGQIDSIAGCGAGSGCANVLGSRWSQVFLIPVTAFSTGLYALLLASTFKPSRVVYAALAICFTGGALWFFGILIFEIKAFCPWCTAMHAIGLVSSILLVLLLRGKKLRYLKGGTSLGMVGGGLAIMVFIAGQIFGPIPQTHLASGGSQEKEDKTTAIHARPQGKKKGRLVAVFDDNKFYNTATLPHLGSSDAPHVIVKYYDYTCEACRSMHQDLQAVAKKHPGKICMIMLPVPLNRHCNEFYPDDAKDHEHACELARLALAGWRAKPEAFEEIHEVLFTRPALPLEIAEISVAQIVGEEALSKSLNDPWVEELLKANVNDYRQISKKTIKMPKLLIGKNRMLHGVTSSPEVLLHALEAEFKLQPKP